MRVRRYIIENLPPAGILIFAPGLGEINDIIDGFTQTISEHGRKPADFWILPLHSSLPTSNQQRVFDAPPKGVIKIVVATNIAETSTLSHALCLFFDVCTYERRVQRGVGRLR